MMPNWVYRAVNRGPGRIMRRPRIMLPRLGRGIRVEIETCPPSCEECAPQIPDLAARFLLSTEPTDRALTGWCVQGALVFANRMATGRMPRDDWD